MYITCKANFESMSHNGGYKPLNLSICKFFQAGNFLAILVAFLLFFKVEGVNDDNLMWSGFVLNCRTSAG